MGEWIKFYFWRWLFVKPKKIFFLQLKHTLLCSFNADIDVGFYSNTNSIADNDVYSEVMSLCKSMFKNL